MDEEKKARLAYLKKVLGPSLERFGPPDERAVDRFLDWRAAKLPSNWRELAARKEAADTAHADLLSLDVRQWVSSEEGPLRNYLFPYAHELDPMSFGAFLGWSRSNASTQWCLDGLLRMTESQRKSAEVVEIYHQAGGFGCLHVELLATPLDLNDRGRMLGEALADHYYSYHAGHFYDARPDDVLEFCKIVEGLGLTAQHVFDESGRVRLMEGVYPLDATPENLEILTGKRRAHFEKLNPILENEEAREQLAVIILADNSD